MPLTKVFRLGPTPQRVAKGYVVSGDPQRTEQFLGQVAGQVLSGFEVRALPPRVVEFRSGWTLLADPVIRDEFRDGLISAVVEIAQTATRQGLRLLPSATRPRGGGSWTEWTCADRHDVSVPSTTESEIVSNGFRAATGLLVALTGRSAIEGELGRANSCRLLHSTDQLFARYLTSASPRNLRQVTDELRRTSGIQSLDVMDVFPGAEGERLQCSLKAVDAQAFVGTTMAHALLIQAMAMRFRRGARQGSRVGRMPDRLLQFHRSCAISSGLSGRVRLDVPRTVNGTEAPITSFEVLVRDLATDLLPEFGSLQVRFNELTPVLGWTVDGAIPRSENEFLQRERLLTPESLADAVARPDAHLRFSSWGDRSQVAGQWEKLTTEPPAKGRGGSTARPDSPPSRPTPEHTARADARRDAPPRGKAQQVRPKSPQDDALGRRAELIAVKDADEETRRLTVAALVRTLPRRTAEIVPWDNGQAEAVKTARNAARPPGHQRRTVTCVGFSADSDRVIAAVAMARNGGWSMLSIEGTADEIRALTSTLGTFLSQLDGCSGALLSVVKFRDAKGIQKAKAEVVIVDGTHA